jgi:hypothetical protein
MITLMEERRDQAPEQKSNATPNQPLPAQARRAVRAAAAVERGELDLEQATRRYGITAALIEAWQHALKTAPPGTGESGGKRRIGSH